MTERILFTADLHGNELQYEKVFKFAHNNLFDVLVFGGDLTPKDPARRTPKQQREFLFEQVFPQIKKLTTKTNTQVLLILGNDDYISNYTLVRDAQDEFGFQLIDDKPYISKNGYIYAGYTHVPYTPFKDKDWERRDLNSHKTIEDRPDDVRVDGLTANGDELVPLNIIDDMMKHSIEDDLGTKMSSLPQDKLIMVTHAPPYNTVCDYTCLKSSLSFFEKIRAKIQPKKYFRHVGSQAVKKYIEDKQPLLTLHGHIHDTVDLTGSYTQVIGRTTIATAGNDNIPLRPYILDVKVSDGVGVERINL